jgi:hypothetical protein
MPPFGALQRKILLKPLRIPFKHPYFLIAKIIYSEHDGTKRHDALNSLEAVF